MDTDTIQQIKHISRRFGDKISTKVDEIESLWFSSNANPSIEAIKEMFRLSHTLAGSAGIFGYDTVGKVARDLTELLRPAVTKAEKVDKHQVTHKIVELKSVSEVEVVVLSKSIVAQQIDPGQENRWRNLLTGLTIMVVDDDEDVRQVTQQIVVRLGAYVVSADCGRAAIERFRSSRPDMIIMDVVMPDMSGDEAASEIKKMSDNSFLPIIFLSSLNESSVVSQCIQQGGDDFIFKPVNEEVLRAKLLAMKRILHYHQELEQYKREAQLEFSSTKELYDALFSEYKKSLPNIGVWEKPAGVVSGDVKLFRKVAGNILYGILGDMTGHGVAAAMGSIVVAEIFIGMTEKQFGIKDIAHELNHKLRQVLPRGHYCAAILLRLEQDSGRLEVINCGLPSAHVLSPASKLCRSFSSRYLPLGVQTQSYSEYSPETTRMGQDEKLLMYTDGIVELEMCNGEFYSDEQLMHDISQIPSQVDIVDYIKEKVSREADLHRQRDDISLVSVALN